MSFIKTGFQQTRATQSPKSSLVNGEFNRSCLQKEERVTGFLEEVGQLTDCYTTKEKPVLTSAIVNHFYVLGEERDHMCLMNAPLTSLCQQDN